MAATSEQVKKKRVMQKSLIQRQQITQALVSALQTCKILDFNYTKQRSGNHAFNSAWCRHKREHQQHEEVKLRSTTVLLHHSSSLMLTESYRQQVGDSQRERPDPGQQRVDGRIRGGT